MAGCRSASRAFCRELAAAAAGVVWGGIAGALKVRSGTNEVIATVLLSSTAIWLVHWCVQSTDPLRQPMSSAVIPLEAPELPTGAQIPLAL
jgi:simple sugar transport system permease protein